LLLRNWFMNKNIVHTLASEGKKGLNLYIKY
jgi:hypothetical protein